MDDITAVEKLRHNAILPTTWSIQRRKSLHFTFKINSSSFGSRGDQ